MPAGRLAVAFLECPPSNNSGFWKICSHAVVTVVRFPDFWKEGAVTKKYTRTPQRRAKRVSPAWISSGVSKALLCFSKDASQAWRLFVPPHGLVAPPQSEHSLGPCRQHNPSDNLASESSPKLRASCNGPKGIKYRLEEHCPREHSDSILGVVLLQP